MIVDLKNSKTVSYILQALLFINTFMIIATFRAREFGDASLDPQILFKFFIWLVSIGFSLMFIRIWAHKFLRYDNIMLLVLLSLIGISCFYSPSFVYSAGAAFSITAVFGLLYASSSIIEDRLILRSLLAAISLVSFISIIYYFVDPDVARLKEWEGGVQVIGTRLSGIAGSPNSIGLASAFGLLIAFFYMRYFKPQGSWWIYLFSAINGLALFMSDSRTSTIALFLALSVVFFARLSVARLSFIFLVAALCLLGAIIVDIETFLAAFSRSGDASEITTGTGRSYIWKTSIELINQKPLTGWGYGSPVFILPQYADVIGHSPAHAHNMLLQVLFSVGYPGMLLFALLYAIKFYYSVKWKDTFKIATLVFLLVNGLTEASIFRGVASLSTLIFAVVLGMEYLKRYDVDDRTDR